MKDFTKGLSGVAEAVTKVMDEQLKGQQHKIDKNKNNKIDAHDFAILRSEKKAPMKKEEVEQVDEVFTGKEPVGTKKKTTMGTAIKTATGMKHERDATPGAEYGSTEWDKEEKSKSMKAPKKKYGARQNYVRSTRVNESFTGLLSQYQEGGLKNLFESLKKEEKEEVLTEEVKEENVEVEVTDLNATNGVAVETIEERTLTEPETAKKEEIVKSMKKGMAGFKERYGDRAKSVMYATAAKIAKEKA